MEVVDYLYKLPLICFTQNKKVYRNNLKRIYFVNETIIVTILNLTSIFETLFRFSNLDIFKNVHFQNPIRLFKNFV